MAMIRFSPSATRPPLVVRHELLRNSDNNLFVTIKSEGIYFRIANWGDLSIITVTVSLTIVKLSFYVNVMR